MRAIDDGNRRWIAENLFLDVPPDVVRAVMNSNGFDPPEVDREVTRALESPYFQGSVRLRNRVHKRDWTLGVYRELGRLRAGGEAIPRRHRLSRDEFFEEYYLQNRAVLITGMFEDWPARRLWDLAYLRERCGDALVEVQYGRDADPDYEVNGPKHKRMMTLADYTVLIERTRSSNDFYMTANNGRHNREALAALWDDIPVIEEYLDPDPERPGFFWLGPKGTRTPFHHDLTNNFMAQVHGRKRVRMIPMWDTPHVYNHMHCYSLVDGAGIDLDAYPSMRNAQVLETELAPGDLLFIPIGWWHYVEALDVSITMSYTNFRLFNGFHETYHTMGDL